jgi:hypothetical protein
MLSHLNGLEGKNHKSQERPYPQWIYVWWVFVSIRP